MRFVPVGVAFANDSVFPHQMFVEYEIGNLIICSSRPVRITVIIEAYSCVGWTSGGTYYVAAMTSHPTPFCHLLLSVLSGD